MTSEVHFQDVPENLEFRDSDYTKPNKSIWEDWPVDLNLGPEDYPLDELDPGHPVRFKAGEELAFFDYLRRVAPVHYCPASIVGPYWSITRFKDIMEIERMHTIFSSSWQWGGIQLGGVRKPKPDPFYHLPMFIAEDPPEHDEKRSVIQPRFTQRALQKMEAQIRQRAGEILDALPIDEEFDWVRTVSVELTGQILAALFDIPQEDRHKLIYWSDTVQNLGNPKIFPTVEAGFKELWKCHDYFAEVMRERIERGEAGDDLISLLRQSEHTNNLPPNEFLGNILLLIVGGNDTTRNSISGSVLAMNEFPDQFVKLKRDHSLIAGMASEAIRWQSPIAHMARTALEDFEFRGMKIRSGDRLALWYISGNRDETEIEDPYQFRVDRPNARHHIAFGFGIHRCVGNRLGEMQLRIIWEEILARFSDIEVVGEPERLQSNFIRGIRTLPVRVRKL